MYTIQYNMLTIERILLRKLEKNTIMQSALHCCILQYSTAYLGTVQVNGV